MMSSNHSFRVSFLSIPKSILRKSKAFLSKNEIFKQSLRICSESRDALDPIATASLETNRMEIDARR